MTARFLSAAKGDCPFAGEGESLARGAMAPAAGGYGRLLQGLAEWVQDVYHRSLSQQLLWVLGEVRRAGGGAAREAARIY